MHLLVICAFAAIAAVRAVATFVAAAAETNTGAALTLFAVATATVKKVVDFVRYLSAGDARSVVTQVLSWVAGIGVAFLLAASDITQRFDIGGGYPLGNANGASLVLIGIGLASGASFGVDLLKARDNSQSAAVPPLGGPDIGD